jgi:hypothetical protein
MLGRGLCLVGSYIFVAMITEEDVVILSRAVGDACFIEDDCNCKCRSMVALGALRFHSQKSCLCCYQLGSITIRPVVGLRIVSAAIHGIYEGPINTDKIICIQLESG